MSRLRKVRDLFEASLEIAEARRPEWLRQACADDPELEREVLALLEANQQAGFLDQPVFQVEEAPRQLGPYEILEEIGRGGMGTVYRAVRADDAFRKIVAIKVIGGGGLRRGTAARFQRERQILAKLEHPNIARILDGGTDRGVSYLVMEYVEGQRIDAYCESHRLGIRDRLLLLSQLCQAAGYAHRNLIVHRDIKPGNVLVTADGVVKLLDFGIAKILDPEDDAASTETVQMTPEYASPEQIRGEPVTPASDVYAIGVMLFQLLTGGALPRRTSGVSFAELVQSVSLEDPAPPSAKAPPEWRDAVRGDLDSIALAALATDPQRRYASAGRMADDLGRFRDGHPVWAHADSAAYRARKFVNRHWIVLSATAAVILTMAVGIVMTVRQARIADKQRALAEQRYQDVRSLATTVLFDIHDQIRALPGAAEARRVAVTKALQYLDSLSKQSQDDRLLQSELASAYQRAGDILGNMADSAVEGTQASLPLYQKALELRKKLLAGNPSDRSQIEALAKAHELAGVGHLGLGQSAEAKANFETAMRLSGGNPMVRIEMLDRLGTVYGMQGDFDRALQHCRDAQKLLETQADVPTKLRARTSRTLGAFLRLAGRNQEAIVWLDRALDLYRKLMDEQPDDINHRRAYAVLLPMLARAYDDLGRRAEADAVWQNALSRLSGMVGPSTVDPQLVLNLAYAWKHTAWNLYRAHQAGKGANTGEAEMARSLEYSGRLAARPKAGVGELTEYADTLLRVPYPKLQNHKRALEFALRANEISGFQSPMVLDTLAWAYHRTGDTVNAIRTMEKCLAMLPPTAGSDRLRKEFEDALREFRKSSTSR